MKSGLTYSLSVALFGVIAVTATPVFSQNGEILLRSWLNSQRDAVREVSTIRVDEKVIFSIDGGFGKQTLRMEATRTGGPGAEPSGRAVQRAEMNGQIIPVERGERFRRQQRGLMRPEFTRRIDNVLFAIQEFARLRVARGITQEIFEGEQMWRVDAAPQEQPDPVERMTAWFDVDEFRLRATHTILGAPGASPIQIRTSYARIDGIDVPIRRHISGSSRVQRRVRYFTTLFDIDTSFSGHTFTVNN